MPSAPSPSPPLASASPPASPGLPPFRTIFDDHFGYVCASARRLGVWPSDVEDVAHDVFVAVHQRLPRYDPTRPLRPWLFGFTLRVALATKRRKAGQRTSELSTELADPAPLADETVHARQRVARLAAALDTISDEQRAVFILHDLDEVPVPEIARALELPLNTAYSRLRLAREGVERALVRDRDRPPAHASLPAASSPESPKP